jgi:PAS domain S-box-containing protein
MLRFDIVRRLSRVWIAWLLLQAGVVATVIVTVLIVRDAQTTQNIAFENTADEIAGAIEARMRGYVDVVYAVRGLFARSNVVAPAEFDRFVASLELQRRYPGMQSIAFAPRVTGERAAFERSVRAFGGEYRNFSISPPGVRNEYFPIVYRVRFGGEGSPPAPDLFADPVRRAAINTARDSGALAALGPVPFISNPGRSAFFLFLPVYRDGDAVATVEARRAGFAGVVRAAFRVEELVASVARGAHLPTMRFALFDVGSGGADDVARLLYDSSSGLAVGAGLDEFGRSGPARTLRFGAHAWRVVVEPPPEIGYQLWFGPLCAGLAISLLLFALVLSLTRASERARALAELSVRKLRSTELRIAKTEEFSSVMVLHAGLDGRLLKMPPTFCRLLAFSEADLLTRRIDDLIHPQQGLAWKRQLRALTEGHIKSADCEKRCMCGDGGEIWLALSCALVSDDDNTPLHLLIYARDITVRIVADAELRRLHTNLERIVEQRTVQLQATNRELESFSYSVSHDLRASVRHISGFARMLDTQLPPTTGADARHHLGRIAAAATRMGELIDDLLFFARATRAELRLSSLDMNSAVQRALDELAPDLAGRHVQMRISVLPAVAADRGLLHQVWVNLLSNAIKYSAPSSEALIEIGSQIGAAGEQVFFVRDNGVGFDPSSAHRLFGVFQRLHTREEFEGTGIGLATVQRIVHRHGGRVWAEGAVGTGATFYFTLPREPAEGLNDELARSAASA